MIYDEVRLLRHHIPKWIWRAGDTQTDVITDREKNHIVQTGRPTGTETTHIIGLVFSQRIIQSEFLMGKITS